MEYIKIFLISFCVTMLILTGYIMYLEIQRNKEVIISEVNNQCSITIPNLTQHGWCLRTDKNQNKYYERKEMKLYIGKIKQ